MGVVAWLKNTTGSGKVPGMGGQKGKVLPGESGGAGLLAPSTKAGTESLKQRKTLLSSGIAAKKAVGIAAKGRNYLRKLEHKYELLLEPVQRRTAAYVFLTAVEIVCLALAFAMVYVPSKHLLHLSRFDAEITLGVTALNYQSKVESMAIGFDVHARSRDVQDYLNAPDPSSSTYEDIVNMLGEELQHRKIEFATLVDADMAILAGANANRTGEIFDPSGVVSLHVADQYLLDRSLARNAILTQEELLAELPPRWSERLHPGNPVPSFAHPYATGGDSLIRWVVNPIMNMYDDDLTLLPSSEWSGPLGFFVTGDIVNGKFAFPGVELDRAWGTPSTHLPNGYMGLYLRQDEENWLTCALVGTRNQWERDEYSRGTILDYDALGLSRSLQQDALDTSSMASTTIRLNSYGVAAITAPNFDASPDEQGIPDLIMVRGVQMMHSVPEIARTFSSQLIIILVATTLMLVLWIMMWVSPIENLAWRQREMRAVDLAAVQGLKETRWVCPVVLTLGQFVILAAFAYSLSEHRRLLYDATASRSVDGLVPLVDAYNSKPQLLIDQFQSLALSHPMVAIADSLAASAVPSAVDIADAQILLEATQLKHQEIEYACLIDEGGNVIADYRGSNALAEAEPAVKALIDLVLESGHPLMRNIIIPHDEYVAQSLPVADKRWYEEPAPSDLAPSAVSTEDVLVRFSAVPVHAAGSGEISAVLVSGDVLNGNLRITDQSNDIYGAGWSAFYLRDESEDNDAPYVLIGSSFLDMEGGIEHDYVPEQTSHLGEAMRAVAAEPNLVYTSWAHLDGTRYILSARCVHQGFDVSHIFPWLP
jgi:hypothetical protein